MPPMTKQELEGMVNDIVTRVTGTTIDDRIKEFQSKEGSAVQQLLSGLGKQKVEAPAEKGQIAVRAMLAIGGAKLSGSGRNPVSPEAFAAKAWGKDAEITKALAAGSLADGGALIGEQMSGDFIELLRPASIFRALRPTIAPMDQGNLTMAKLTGGATAGYIGENQPAGKTQQTTGNVKATAKKVAALIPISNDLIRRTSGNTESMLRDDAVAAVGQASDLAFLRNPGSSFSPRGLKYWCPAANTFHANATINLDNVSADLSAAILKLAAGDCRFIRPGWAMSPRTWLYLMRVRDGNGNYAFRDEMMAGTLWGWPFKWTTQIPSNLGSGADESEITLCDFADAVLAEATNMLVDVSTEAAYFDGTNVVAAFSNDQTVIRVILEHDLVMRHDGSIALIDQVKWA